MTTSFDWSLPRGAIVKGKWKHGSYRVERLLGEGANGKVYLVESARNWYAMKIGADAVDLQSEVNVLQSIAQQRKGARSESYLIDVDDMRASNGKEYPFYIMRYIKGAVLSDYLLKEGTDWFPVVGCNLLGKLAELHSAGWVFGDVKIENVLVASYGRVELVDYGGVTAMGKSVRQFTEIYDRGYWNAGTRVADAQYDLFSFAVLCIQLYEGRRLAQLSAALLPQNRMPEELLKLVAVNPQLKSLSHWLRKALLGEFQHTREAVNSWRQWMNRPGNRRSSAPASRWIKGLFVASAAALATTIYWFLRTS
ncbi:serine/threonine protein kinase [Paenibacillus sp. GCM10027626]|uniref:protein kinase domain-containing protein n=1 Tax=Paenibacillus sp. GCM10027626 TaxID=3273411 RepID=UPI0036338ECF